MLKDDADKGEHPYMLHPIRLMMQKWVQKMKRSWRYFTML